MRVFGWSIVALVAVGVGACGDGSEDVRAGTPTRDPNQRYEVDATVLSSNEHGPELCAGAIAASLPPQCGGPPIANFDWSSVEDKESAGDTTWAELHLVGTFDGTTFTLTAPPEPPVREPQPPEPRFDTPCATPAGGWRVVDDAKISNPHWIAVGQYAREQPDFAGSWVDQSINPDGPTNDETKLVLNLRFTDDLDTHERETRARWGGPLCVSEARHTQASLQEVQSVVSSDEAKAAGLQTLSASVDEVRNLVEIEALLADEVVEQWVDERFGPGIVELRGRLRPVDD